MSRRAKKKNKNFYVGQESQVSQFIKKCQRRYEDLEPNYKILCTDLQKTLQKIFPGCKVNRFGSTVTGLYFTDSDVDIFVELVEKNPFIFDASEFIKVSKALLYKYGNLYGEITGIPFCRTPICKFLHKPTNLHCDFNFKSVIGVYNSWFIRYYLSLDKRLVHLMLVIKYWAKMHCLTSTSDFSNYSIVLMFIFYLQHVHSLPPVINLQTASSINVQEDWNVGMDYSPNPDSFQSLKESTAEDILLGFFDYYASFSYDLDIICPYLGHPITKADFLRFDSLEPLFKLYKINTFSKKPLQVQSEICVQDPFEHVNNVTGRVKKVCLKNFVKLCKKACQIFEKRPVSSRALEELFEIERIQSVRETRKNRRKDSKKIQKMFGLADNRINHRRKKNRKEKMSHKQLVIDLT